MEGILVINKPIGITSFKVIEILKKKLFLKKIGYLGTLDPLATGVLPVCLNNATKISQYFLNDIKVYFVTCILGIETDTLDINGTILSKCEVKVPKKKVIETLLNFIGKQEQIPPFFSAVKYKGKPLYKLARKGIYIIKQPRQIEIFNIKIQNISLPIIKFFISCTKGTYIRSLCAELGNKLAIKGCLMKLHRIQSGFFCDFDAIEMKFFEKKNYYNNIKNKLISLNDSLPHIQSINVKNDNLTLIKKIKTGSQLILEDLESCCKLINFFEVGKLIKILSYDNQLLAIGKFIENSCNVDFLNKKAKIIKLDKIFLK